MKTIEHEGHQYQAAENIWELQLGPLIDILELMQGEHDQDDLSYQMRLLSLISSIPMETIEEMDFARFVQLAELLTFDPIDLPSAVTAEDIGQGPDKAPSSFVVDGQEYFFQPHYAFGKVGTIARVEDLLKGKDLMTHLHYVLALIAYRREDECFDPDLINERAQLMTKARAIDVWKPLVFFCNNDLPYSSAMTSCLRRVQMRAARSTRSSPNGVGAV